MVSFNPNPSNSFAWILPTIAHTSIVGTVAQARIRRSVFSCRPHCHSCRWSSHSLLSWRMLWYRLYHVFVLIYLIVFITDCFIRKWCTKRILIPSTFVGSFCLSNWFLYLLVGLLSGCLVGCLVIVRRAWLLWSQQDFEWRWSVPLFKCLTVLEFSVILFDLCLLITFFNFIMNYVPIVTFWISTYHKIWILSIMFCFIWSYWIIYFLACLEVSWRVVS